MGIQAQIEKKATVKKMLNTACYSFLVMTFILYIYIYIYEYFLVAFMFFFLLQNTRLHAHSII
jgi:hypothetical protein